MTGHFTGPVGRLLPGRATRLAYSTLTAMMPIQATTTPGSSAVLPATAVTGMPSAIEPMATPICPGAGS